MWCFNGAPTAIEQHQAQLLTQQQLRKLIHKTGWDEQQAKSTFFCCVLILTYPEQHRMICSNKVLWRLSHHLTTSLMSPTDRKGCLID